MTRYLWLTNDIVTATGLTADQVRALLAAHRRIGTPGVGKSGRYEVKQDAFDTIFGAIAAERRRQLEIEAEMERARLAKMAEGRRIDAELRRIEAEERLALIQAAEPYRARFQRRAGRGYRPARYPLSKGAQHR